MGNKVINLLDRLLDTALVIVGVLLLLIGVYSMLDNLWLNQNASDRSFLIYRPALDEPLTPEKKITENQVAWVTLDDTNIDYPIMQGKNNSEYLNKDPYGEYSLSGSIFLDSRCDPALGDPYSLVYGHNMSHGAMFGALDEYREKPYFNAHRTGTIVTDESIFDYRLFAVAFVEATDETVFNPSYTSREDILAFLKKNAMIYTEPTEGARIVALSTCSDATSLMRLLVFGTIQER